MKNYTDLIKELRHKLASLPSLHEENIKIHIIVDLFLAELGYDCSVFIYEKKCLPGFADIYAPVKSSDGLFIEVKTGEKEIDPQDLSQLLGYMNNKNCDWGILSNGFRYILLNRNIIPSSGAERAATDMVVFDISLNHKTDIQFIKYFSKETIFDNQTSYFFVHIRQFKNFKTWPNGNSWASYKCTLFNFFDYYSNEKGYNYFGGNYREALTRVDILDFFNYINYRMQNSKGNKKLTSKQTILNSYSYLSSFFETLKQHSYIPDHNFKYSRRDILSKYEDTPKIKGENHLTEKRFEKALNHIYSQQNNYRNLVIFLLCGYYAIERSYIDNLKWEQVNMNKRTIDFGDRQIKMNDLMFYSLEKIEKMSKQKRKKNQYVLLRHGKNGLEKASIAVINMTFDDLQRIDESDPIWRNFSPQYVRGCLIQEMFNNGYTIEQIIYETRLNLQQLSAYLPYESICKQGKLRSYKQTPIPKHPYEKVVNSFYRHITGKKQFKTTKHNEVSMQNADDDSSISCLIN